MLTLSEQHTEFMFQAHRLKVKVIDKGYRILYLLHKSQSRWRIFFKLGSNASLIKTTYSCWPFIVLPRCLNIRSFYCLWWPSWQNLTLMLFYIFKGHQRVDLELGLSCKLACYINQKYVKTCVKRQTKRSFKKKKKNVGD